MRVPAAVSRMLALDYLRGFFIVIIVIDHLWRWPNIFEYVSGRGELWASAAEGFVIISGLLVGYVRGYKNRDQPLFTVSKKLVKRGALLYIWMVITTIVLVAVSWSLSFKGNLAYIPINTNDWATLFQSAVRLDYVHSLTHFLYLYAIFLFIAPVVVWLLRKSLAWVVAVTSLAVWFAGFHWHTEWMQWQILFFLPTIAGFYFETLRQKFQKLSSSQRKGLVYGSITATLATIVTSALIILPTTPGTFEQTLFNREPLTLARILIAFIWFVGLFALFEIGQKFIQKYLGWLLLPFGTHSLTAYIVHVIPLMACQLLVTQTDNIWINSLLAAACVILTWAIIKIPHINRVIPR